MPEVGMPLWGFTYRLIAEWLKLAGDEGGVEMVVRMLAASGIEVSRDGDGRGVTSGPIPVERVVALLGEPWPQVPAVNVVEVRREWIKVTDLGYREYLIAAV
jgi:hypothetical protein